jgi:hypothetical protein
MPLYCRWKWHGGELRVRFLNLLTWDAVTLLMPEVFWHYKIVYPGMRAGRRLWDNVPPEKTKPLHSRLLCAGLSEN